MKNEMVNYNHCGKGIDKNNAIPYTWKDYNISRERIENKKSFSLSSKTLK